MFTCEGTNRLAVYNVTTCAGGVCTYTAKTGLDSSYSFDYDVRERLHGQ